MTTFSPTRLGVTLLRQMAILLFACCLLAASEARAACTVTGACVSTGPRLATVDTAKSALLNPLLGGLLGTNLNLTAVDWNTLAQGDVNLLGFLTKLQLQTNASNPAQALNAHVTLGQITAALEEQAQAQTQVDTSLAGVLDTLGTQLGSVGATVRVGDLVQVSTDTATLAATTVNSLDMLTGLIQLYNRRNVLTTPTPIGISGGLVGALGILNSVQLYAQVVEPAVYLCGPAGSTFHSAAIRLKLKLDLVTLAPVTDLLTALLGNTSIAIGQLDVYVEVGRGEGRITGVDGASRTVSLQALPGIADLYIGKIDDSVFFNRARPINVATDLGYGKVGGTTLNQLKITEPIPAFTTFSDSACGTLGAGLASCTVSTQPAVGAAGNVVWTFLGTLLPGATGTVQVKAAVQ